MRSEKVYGCIRYRSGAIGYAVEFTPKYRIRIATACHILPCQVKSRKKGKTAAGGTDTDGHWGIVVSWLVVEKSPELAALHGLIESPPIRQAMLRLGLATPKAAGDKVFGMTWLSFVQAWPSTTLSILETESEI